MNLLKEFSCTKDDTKVSLRIEVHSVSLSLASLFFFSSSSYR